MDRGGDKRGVQTSEFWLGAIGPVLAAVTGHLASLPQPVAITLLICSTVAAVAWMVTRSLFKVAASDQLTDRDLLLNPPLPRTALARDKGAGGFVMRKFLMVVVAVALVALVSVSLIGGLSGCVSKPGTEALQPEGLSYRDPSLTHSTAQLGFENATQIGGPLTQQTAKLTADGLQETNGGGAAVQRVAIDLDKLLLMLSAGSDLDVQGIDATLAEGKLTSIKVARLGTNNSAVQRAVNEGLGVLVAQWIKASENERAVLEASLKAQSELGSTVAQAALTVIAGLK
jgi:hypothetical protein